MPASNSLNKLVPELLHERIQRHWLDWQNACKPLDLSPSKNMDLPLLGKIWASSEFMAMTMIRNPKLWFGLQQKNLLDNNLSLTEYQQLLFDIIAGDGAFNEALLMQQLRLFRAQHMLRIAWRDLAKLSTTKDTLKNLTDLAQVCVDVTLEKLYQNLINQIGTPLDVNGIQQRLIVLGMGKLGGHELNFSSDIDLIFFYAEEGEIKTAASRPVMNSQFFTRLGQQLIKVINDVTGDGFVFRVDMRLRPYGDSGPLVMSFAGLEHYYQSQGRNWERYAMIKARVIAGHGAQAKQLMQLLKPFIYRRYLDFGAFESIREMKAMIDREIRRKGNLQNIKLGSGGIREIEFIGQTFQLLRGGSEPELQVRGILDVLQCLADKSYLKQQETDVLVASYDFLRRLENRLQMYRDEQNHVLPEDELQQTSMALAMDYKNWQELLTDCDKCRQLVQASFKLLLHKENTGVTRAEGQALSEDAREGEGQDDEAQERILQAIWNHALTDEETLAIFNRLGMVNGAEVLHQLQQFKSSSPVKTITSTSRQRLDKLMPTLLQCLIAQGNPAEVLKRLLGLLQSILRRSVYLSLLNEYPAALKQLVKLFAASPWLAQLLSRYPILLDELLDPRSLYQISTQAKLNAELGGLLSQVEGDEEQQLEILRKFKQAQVLKIAAMDIAGVLDVFEVSQQLSNLAEVLLDKVMLLSCQWIQAKHGIPSCIIEGEVYRPTLAVVAYGKMGGRELGYSSDLDLVFLHDSQGMQQQTNGKRSLDNASFFARLAQRVIHLLGLRTANGRLYEIDMRLRPDGNAGMLVSSVQAYDQYQHNKAWTWEHQALIRSRILSSNEHLKAEFDRIRYSVLSRPRVAEQLAAEVIEMRLKMRLVLGSKNLGSKVQGSKSSDVRGQINKSGGKLGGELFHIKQDEGGLVDIEFIAQFGLLLNAAKDPKLVALTGTGKILAQLAHSGLLNKEQVEILTGAYRDYRACSHQLALQQLPSVIEGRQFELLRGKVKNIWQNVIEKNKKSAT